MLARRFRNNLQFVFGMRSVIKTRMVLHDLSTRYVWRCGDNRAAKTFSINLLFGKYLYMGSWLQCLVCVLVVEHFVLSIHLRITDNTICAAAATLIGRPESVACLAMFRCE